jgi:hypothetical protein
LLWLRLRRARIDVSNCISKMNRLLLLLCFAIAPGLRAELPTEPGPELILGENDAAWQPLFAALAAKGTVCSAFTEQRWFPFRKTPVVLEGEMRFSPARGLSLRYVRPDERLMIADARGLLLRDARGRNREVPADPRAPDINAALLPVLRFDRAELGKTFHLFAVRAGEEWRLDFVPRAAELARTLGRITVIGAGDAVRRLEFRRSATQRVEIIIGATQTGVLFTPDEEKRFFR